MWFLTHLTSKGDTMSKAKTPKVPRTMEEIQKAYQQLCANAGQCQYQIFALNEELTRINEGLKAVNNEGAARQQLDREAAARAEMTNSATTTPTTEQQSTVS